MNENAQAPLTQSGHHSARSTRQEVDVVADLLAAFETSQLPLSSRLHDFPRHVRRQEMARLFAKYELFKLTLPVAGSIVECGVFAGGGLLTWLHCSSILEPYNHTRRIIGFDTFTGFPDPHVKDTAFGSSEHLHPGAFQTHGAIKEEIERLVQIHDRNRPLGHLPKVELVAGDACKTLPEYVGAHPHLLVSLIYMDFDLYEPTRVALQQLYPRVVKGGVVAFDELNCAEFPGETQALLETLDTHQTELRRFSFEPYISYFVKE